VVSNARASVLDLSCREQFVVVVGTRPEAVKLAPIVDALGDRARLVHTGQHFSPELAAEFHIELGLRSPDAQLAIGGRSRSDQVRSATRQLGAWWRAEPPIAVVVQGDTNTALAGALGAHHAGVPIVHVEAGLRSDDRAMPEEHNRLVIDHLCALACAPTGVAATRLRAEFSDDQWTSGDHPRIVVTGNTVVDALLRRLPSATQIAGVTNRFGVAVDRFVLATLHRPENVDDPARLMRLLAALEDAPVPVLLPLHPRTRARLSMYQPSTVRLLDPLPYGEFLSLLAACAVCVSDSGGVQEEASVLKRPVIVVRRTTERPEVIGTFAELISEPSSIVAALNIGIRDVASRRDALRSIPSPYGDGTAAAATVAALDESFPR
jgi:UDP-N-acetylglucosamine 2-epimerase (non-hydrolysing)